MEELSNYEKAAECIYALMRAKKLTKEEYVRRMTALDETPEGRVSSCYCTWLLLRILPPPEEKQMHWGAMIARLCAALSA